MFSSPVQACLLGIVQGVTEFLPVSSTAHLLLSERWLGYQDPGGVFTVMIQLGSILAVVWLYRAKLVEVAAGLPGDPRSRRFVLTVLVAFLPAVVGGALFAGYVKRVLYGTLTVVAVAFIVGGIVMLAVERWRKSPTIHAADGLPVGHALFVGMWQVLALVPGVSRSGATMVGGMLAGVDRAAVTEFSFFLAMPTMSAAFAHDFLQARHHLAPGRATDIAIGFVAAFLASAAVVKPFLGYVRRSGFAPFAWYRILLGLALLAAIAAGRV